MDNLDVIKIDKVVNEVVKTLLPKGTRDKVLMFNIVLSLDNYKNEDKSVYKNLYIAYYSPNNFTRVGYRIGNEGKFIHVANHDSCWREGVSRALKETNELILKDLESKNIFNDDVKDFHIDTNFGLTGIKLHDNSQLVYEKTGEYEGFYHLEKC